MFRRREQRNYKGTHVCVTGGSEGLGFEIAKLFVDEGANVSIVARTAGKLETALALLEKRIRQNKGENRVYTAAGDCSRFESIEEALARARAQLGPVDVLIANAGTAAPGRFLETELEDFESQIKTNYLGTVYTVKSVIKDMVQRRSGEIVLISSALGVLGMTGYCAYAPTKWAIRGFADCLRMEMQAYKVSVRIAYPPNMATPGYQTELERTPGEVKDMMDASGDAIFPPDAVARSIMKGMKQGKYHLPSPDTLQTFSQTAMAGLTPTPYPLPFQAILNFVCTLLFAYFVRVFDRITTRHARQRETTD